MNEQQIGPQQSDAQAAVQAYKNIIIIGVSGSGKSVVGEMLAHRLGFGFIDTDRWIEEREKKTIARIFEDSGEDYFRAVERQVAEDLKIIRNHVVSAGGGIVVDDDAWQTVKSLGVVVWLNTSPEEVARRIVMKPDEIRKRPLLADIVNIEDRLMRQKALVDRVQALIDQRKQRYEQADIVVQSAFSTPELSVRYIKSILKQKKLI